MSERKPWDRTMGNGCWQIRDETGTIVAECKLGHIAARIVRCVNAGDDPGDAYEADLATETIPLPDPKEESAMSQRKPWKLQAMNAGYDVLDATGSIVFRCFNEDIAAQIVREHNAHDDMVKALQKLVRVAGLVPVFQYGDGGDALEAGIAAIAKAKQVKPL
jgi:hypothetical protein